MAKVTSAYYPPGEKVTVKSGTYQGKDLAGMTGVVRGHNDMAQDDVVHVVDLHEDHHFTVPNGTPNPPGQYGGNVHGPEGPQPREWPITYVEVPLSCLE